MFFLSVSQIRDPTVARARVRHTRHRFASGNTVVITNMLSQLILKLSRLPVLRCVIADMDFALW